MQNEVQTAQTHQGAIFVQLGVFSQECNKQKKLFCHTKKFHTTTKQKSRYTGYRVNEIKDGGTQVIGSMK